MKYDTHYWRVSVFVTTIGMGAQIRGHLKYIVLSQIFPHIIRNVRALQQTELSTILMFRWSFSVLNPELASDIIRLEESGTMKPCLFSLTSWVSFYFISKSVVYSVFQWEQSSHNYLIIYYHMSISSVMDLGHFSMYPAIKEIEQTISVYWGFELTTFPWVLNLVIKWRTNNRSQHLTISINAAFISVFHVLQCRHRIIFFLLFMLD